MNKKMIISLIGIIIIILFSVICSNVNVSKENAIQTNSGIELSNSKIEWGIKRSDNHEQPDLGKRNRELIEKYNGLAVGNLNDKEIYLTFDLGYEAGYTNNILDILKENNVKATFFVTAHYVNTASDIVQRMIDEGHIVGNHTVNHYSMPSLSEDKLKDEVMNLHQAVYEKFNYEMKYLRPPKGEYSEKTLAEIQKLGYKTVMWSFAYDDWDESKQGREEYAKNKVLSNTHNGEIILLHANSIDNSNILDYCIKEIKNNGYEFKTLDEFKV